MSPTVKGGVSHLHRTEVYAAEVRYEIYKSEKILIIGSGGVSEFPMVLLNNLIGGARGKNGCGRERPRWIV